MDASRLLIAVVCMLCFYTTSAKVLCGGCRISRVRCSFPQPICPPPASPCCAGYVQDGGNCTYDPTYLDSVFDVGTQCANLDPIPEGAAWDTEMPVTSTAAIFLNDILREMPIAEDRPISPHIINGQNATYGQFPWQVVLAYNGFFTCGATIISPWWVLTAAHCVDGRSVDNFLVLAGVKRLSTYDSGQVVKNAAHIIIHPRYDFPYADIALIKVDTPFVWTPNVQPACLPRECHTRNEHAVKGVKYMISGHGAVNAAGNIISDQLQFAEVVIRQLRFCGRIYGRKTFRNVLCVSDDGEGDFQSSCKGDSGGPLTFNNILLGVTSFGSERCETYPVGYTHVSPYLTWIRVVVTKRRYSK